LFQRRRVSGLIFRADYLPRLSVAHNTSIYGRTLYRHVTGRNVRFSDFSPSSAVDVVEKKSRYRRYCFSAEGYQEWSLERIIYHDCPLVTARRYIDELCIGTSPGEMCDFRIFRQVRRSTSSKRKKVSAILFYRKRASGLVFREVYLARLSAAHNPSKY